MPTKIHREYREPEPEPKRQRLSQRRSRRDVVAWALFVLPGGDSPWHKNRSGPAAIPGARNQPGMAGAPSISQSRLPAGSPPPGMAGTACRCGRRIFAPDSAADLLDTEAIVRGWQGHAALAASLAGPSWRAEPCGARKARCFCPKSKKFLACYVTQTHENRKNYSPFRGK